MEQSIPDSQVCSDTRASLGQLTLVDTRARQGACQDQQGAPSHPQQVRNPARCRVPICYQALSGSEGLTEPNSPGAPSALRCASRPPSSHRGSERPRDLLEVTPGVVSSPEALWGSTPPCTGWADR